MARIRARNAVVAALPEDTESVFQAPDPALHATRAFNIELNTETETEPDESLTGTRFKDGDIVGGTKVRINLTFYLKGTGTPGAAPEWEIYPNIAGFGTTITATQINSSAVTFTAANQIQVAAPFLDPLTVGTPIFVSGAGEAANNDEFVVTAVAAGEITVARVTGTAGLTAEAAGADVAVTYGIPAVAATAGGESQATLQAPWAGTEHLYAGMPVLVSGNPAQPVYSTIATYSDARVGALTEKFTPVLDNTSVLGIPANWMIKPITDDIPTASFSFWNDGLRYDIRGLAGTRFTMTWDTAKTVKVTLEAEGLFESEPFDEAMPGSVVFDASKPGTFRGSRFAIDGDKAQIQSFTLGMENTTAFPGDPNDAEGFDYPEVGEGVITGSLDPLLVLTATRNLFARYRSGNEVQLVARLLGGQASAPGSRIVSTVPRAQLSSHGRGDRDGLVAEQVNYKSNGGHEACAVAIY